MIIKCNFGHMYTFSLASNITTGCFSNYRFVGFHFDCLINFENITTLEIGLHNEAQCLFYSLALCLVFGDRRLFSK